MTTDDGRPIEVGYIIVYDVHPVQPLAPDRPIPEMEWGQVLEIDKANRTLVVEFQDGRRDTIAADAALAPMPQEEWERQTSEKWRVKRRLSGGRAIDRTQPKMPDPIRSPWRRD